MLAAFALAGCLRDIPPGPDLGRCAVPPTEGTYDYGSVGIGSCLAGPADIRFFEQDGGTFLAVSNADPFRNFTSGSLLVVDWNDVVSRIDVPDPPDRLFMDELVTFPLPIFDDDDGDGEGENAYLGNFGYLPGSRTAIIPGRMTEGAALRSGIDEAWFADLDQLEQPGAGPSLIGSLELEDDPYLVDVDTDADRVYVGNLTDHSISVLTTAVPDGSALPVQKIDVAPEAKISDGAFTDADASDSFAEIAEAGITDVTEVIEDDWTLTYVDATTRLYVPTTASTDVTGVQRWTSGGGPFIESPFGIEFGLGDVNDPFYTVDVDGIPYLYFARDNGDIVRAVGDLVVGNWEQSEGPLLSSGIDPLRGAPSIAPLPAATGMWYDRRPDGGDAWIELAASSDNLVFQEIGPVIGPTAGVSYEDPQVSLDPRAGRYRMWLSVRQGTAWSIGLSESEDGVVWAEPQIVLSMGVSPVAAPAVGLLDGRYEMYVSVSDGVFWDLARSTSIDGINWSAPEFVIDGDQPITGDPPRPAIHIDTVGAWRLEGVDQGPNGSLLPAGLGGAADIVDDDDPLLIRRMGFVLGVSHGHEVSNDVVPSGRAALVLAPVSVGTFGGQTLLYASVQGNSGGVGIAALSENPASFGTGEGRWSLEVSAADFEDQLNVASGREVFSPVVATDDQGAVLFYAASGPDGVRIRRAESTDGLNWIPIPGTDLLGTDEETGWDSVAQAPHAIEFTADGVRLWYTGDDGGVFRIGSATAPSLRDVFAREPGDLDPWRLAAGTPGGFDDSGVKDPIVVDIDGVPHIYYAGFDGSTWRIGHGTIDADGVITVRTDLSRGVPFPAMSGAERTFSSMGVESPALYSAEPDQLTLLYAGNDGLALRLGRAVIDPRRPDEVFADPRRPTPDDTMTFVSTRGGPGAQVIELEQLTGTFGTSGEGMTSMVRDPGLGFLYVTSKKDDIVYVVDIRDDTTGTFVDENKLDLEDIMRVDTGSVLAGFRDAVLSPEDHLLYLSMRQPDGIVIIDTSRLVDDAKTEAIEEVAVATLPLPSFEEDAGVDTLATFGGAGMALTGHLLLTTHFRGNGVSVLDRDLGAWGEEIAWIQEVGENPHVVRVSPDGRWAVVANYLGDVDDDFVSSTLAIIDLDSASDRYLQVVAWMANL